MSRIREGALVLADGTVFEGELIGAEVEVTSGEVVFNTVLSGYQEVISDRRTPDKSSTSHIHTLGTMAFLAPTQRPAALFVKVS